ncbi:MAG: hypothetical protein M3Y28_10030 [Armatimonadota bacterium]|nr:hypothetical protein [Armatimonadota bacterium]
MSNATAIVRFADSPNTQKYADVLIHLQRAICAGDESEAGRLCDASQDLAESLSIPEILWTQKLSSDLEMLCDEELLQPNPYSPQDYLRRLDRAFAQKDAEALLALLRMEQQVLTKERIATARSQAYLWLGFPQVAHEFLGAATRFAPDSIRRPAFA